MFVTQIVAQTLYVHHDLDIQEIEPAIKHNISDCGIK